MFLPADYVAGIITPAIALRCYPYYLRLALIYVLHVNYVASRFPFLCIVQSGGTSGSFQHLYLVLARNFSQHCTLHLAFITSSNFSFPPPPPSLSLIPSDQRLVGGVLLSPVSRNSFRASIFRAGAGGSRAARAGVSHGSARGSLRVRERRTARR